MQQLSVVHYHILLCVDTYRTDAIAVNKLCKLKFRYFAINYVSAAGLSGLVLV